MPLMPIHKAYLEEHATSAYLFYCPHRTYPIVVTYIALVKLAQNMKINTPLALFEIKDMRIFNSMPFIMDEPDDEPSMESQLLKRGFSISKISKITDIHPIEISFYFNYIVFMDDITASIIFKKTGNEDIKLRRITWGAGERVSEIARAPVLVPAMV
jgi:hypothetical protein